MNRCAQGSQFKSGGTAYSARGSGNQNLLHSGKGLVDAHPQDAEQLGLGITRSIRMAMLHQKEVHRKTAVIGG